MRFGRVALDEAEGAILAHATDAGNVTFKKGRRLTGADIAALRDAGATHVVAARLDADDVDEDAAARRLAEAVAGDQIEPGRAFTGRVNLASGADGILAIDVATIDRLNHVDEAVTIGTLPQHEAVGAGQMVATVKIIPFAVPESVLDHCLAIVEKHGPPLRVAPFRSLSARLIQTRMPRTRDKVLDKTVEITRRRMEQVDGVLAGESRCSHETDALADEIGGTLDRGCDLLLIAGASAITDRRDVLPAAIEAAGGTVEHFGMPVDPGNLLLLARIGSVPVLGLPGCARSPKLNGFDWVLQRLAAGVPVGRDEIMRMGVGGLLTEIPSRPQPRARPVERAAAHPRVAAIVLAAGQSRRMGRRNKLLAEIDGIPMVVRSVVAAIASKAECVVVVTGHEHEKVAAALAGRDVRLVHNPDFADGLSTSLRAGIAALPEGIDGALVCLGDMPRIGPDQLDRLIDAFNPVEGRAICVPTVDGKRGNPVLWGAAFFDEMAGLEGDVGARHLIGLYAEQVVEVETDDSVLVDIDTPEALTAFTGTTS